MQTNETTKKLDYPSKAITLIVPFGAGSGHDIQARILEKFATKHLNQPLTIINKPGGGGTIGWNELADSVPDGYTIGTSSHELLFQPLLGSTKYNYAGALEPLAQITTRPLVLVVKADQAWQNLNDLLQDSAQHPNALKFGHAGIGSTAHIVAETFAKSAKLSLEQVPFHGGGDVLSALLGNHIQFAFLTPEVVKEQIKAGKLRALAISGNHRFIDPALAEIPTLQELGLNIVFTSWTGIAAPKDLAPNIKAQLEATLKAIILDPNFKASMEKQGLQVEYLNAADSQQRWLDDSVKLEKMLTETGILEQIRAQKR